MTESVRKLLEEALRLDPKQRAALTALLLKSLESESNAEIEQAWIAEIERRLVELDSGTVQTTPWDEVRDRLKTRR